MSTSRKAFLRDFPSRETEDSVGRNVRGSGDMEIGAEGETNVSHIMQEVQDFHETDCTIHMRPVSRAIKLLVPLPPPKHNTATPTSNVPQATGHLSVL